MEPSRAVKDLASAAADALYVAVGFGIIAADRIQGRGRALGEQVGVDLPELRARLVPGHDRAPTTGRAADPGGAPDP